MSKKTHEVLHIAYYTDFFFSQFNLEILLNVVISTMTGFIEVKKYHLR